MGGTLAWAGNLAIRKSKIRLRKTTPNNLLPQGVPQGAANATMPFVPNARTRWGEGSLLQPIVSQERERRQGARNKIMIGIGSNATANLDHRRWWIFPFVDFFLLDQITPP